MSKTTSGLSERDCEFQALTNIARMIQRRSRIVGNYDWRKGAARLCRRVLGGQWHCGGHHVGRYHFAGDYMLAERKPDCTSTVQVVAR